MAPVQRPIHLQSYAYHSYEHFKTMFAPLNSSTVQLIKAGVGGTPSELGVIRYERDVLRDGSVRTGHCHCRICGKRR